jgi:hypothetical protein
MRYRGHRCSMIFKRILGSVAECHMDLIGSIVTMMIFRIRESLNVRGMLHTSE